MECRTPSESFLRELRAIDPDLDVLFLEEALRPTAHHCILGTHPLDCFSLGAKLALDRYKRTIKKPRWHVVQRTTTNHVVHLFELQNPDGTFRDLDSRLLKQLREDLLYQLQQKYGRDKAGGLLTKLLMENKEAEQKLAEEAHQQKQDDWIEANKRKIEEAMENTDRVMHSQKGTIGISEVRDPKTITYPGQTTRTSSAERSKIPLTAKEAGWEQHPDWDDEN